MGKLDSVKNKLAKFCSDKCSSLLLHHKQAQLCLSLASNQVSLPWSGFCYVFDASKGLKYNWSGLGQVFVLVQFGLGPGLGSIHGLVFVLGLCCGLGLVLALVPVFCLGLSNGLGLVLVLVMVFRFLGYKKNLSTIS